MLALPTRAFWRVALGLMFAVLGLFPFRAAAEAGAAPTPAPTPAPVNENVVVSANRDSTPEAEIPGAVTVVTGEELKQRNVTNLADAIQDVVGLDTGMGSDNGPRQPNVGLWGLKEFDALLFMVDGVPIGGPFNPSLSQINIDDIDHIEIVKGPQGTLYGVAAFAGMVQVFTKSGTFGTSVRLSGGSFDEGRVDFSTAVPVGRATLKVFGNFSRADGWQDRTDYADDRGGFRLDTPLGDGGVRMSVVYNMFRNTQDFGSPLPVDPPTGEVIPGFQVDRNYEPIGARLDHRVYALTDLLTIPLTPSTRLENTLGLTYDSQISVRSFIGEVDGNFATASGVSLKPIERDFYDDLHVVTQFEGAGHHRLVGGAAVTWGRTKADGFGFDIDLQIDPVVVPNMMDVPHGDNRSFNDRRTFVGFYANDEWTPVPFLTVSGGLRLDTTSETLHVQQQEVGDPVVDVTDDHRSDTQLSGGGSILARLVMDRAGALNEMNFYVSGKTAFKPAAPNLSEAEDAHILEPERTISFEGGLKSRFLEHQLSVDLSVFRMDFKNEVVSILGPDGNPQLTNAGKTRFQGVEVELGYHPCMLPDFSVYGGYAHHDARYVHFSFIDPDEGLLVADGQRLELTPRDLWNAMLSYHPSKGPGAWFAIRHQNQRPFDKINEAYMPSFFEYDAGVSWDFGIVRVSVVGRNLGDSRHYVAESEIGDAQLYVAPPRRFFAELGFRF
ncbi:MAG TPA: TonB-dependent receptor [Thermoanaerobaculia bacterium]